MNLTGRYVGQTKIRPGMEAELAPAERARYARSNERIDLEIFPDETFLYKGATRGAIRSHDDGSLEFIPETLAGETLEQLVRKSEENGREFRLHFLFKPFRLWAEGDTLVTPIEDSQVLVTEFRRS